jgi:5-methylcytosine-specific restriction endonuclease McrA
MQAHYDHILPHSRGGNCDMANLVIACGPCNYGRGNHTLDEMRLTDPFVREPTRSDWDGLERLLNPLK